MLTILKRTTAIVALTATTMLAPVGSAEAGGLSIHIGSGYGHYGSSYGYRYKPRHYYRKHYRKKHYGKHYRPSHRYYGHRGYNYYRKPRVHYGHRHSYRPRCHPVHKHIHNDYGHRTKVRGTMCYDRYGKGYVVPGSRHVVKRY